MLGAASRHPKEKPCDKIDTLIGTEAKFKGNITFSGGLRIDGKVEGNITAEDAGNAILILGNLAEVHGDITVPHVIANGEIRGQINCSACLELESQARIRGEVHYKVLAIAHGATIHGNLVCTTAQESANGVVTRLTPAVAPRDGKL